MLTCGHPFLTVDPELLQPEEVVAVRRPALVEVQAPASERTSLGDDHTFDAVGRHVHLGRDRE